MNDADGLMAGAGEPGIALATFQHHQEGQGPQTTNMTPDSGVRVLRGSREGTVNC